MTKDKMARDKHELLLDAGGVSYGGLYFTEEELSRLQHDPHLQIQLTQRIEKHLRRVKEKNRG